MKAKFTLFTLFIAAFIVSANAQAWQVPNGGMETWTNPTNPDSWGTLESAFAPAPIGTLVSKNTNDKVEGTASAQIVSDSIQAGPTKRLVSGILTLGALAYAPPSSFNFVGAPFAYRPDTLFIAYKYTPSPSFANDSASLVLSISGVTGDLIPLSGLNLPATNNNWVGFFIPLTGYYQNAGPADSLRITFFSSYDTARTGSTLLVDDISFGYVNLPTAINSIVNNVSVDMFPNPAKDVLNISVEGAEEVKAVEIFDITGKLVLTESVSSSNTKINTTDLANGSYIVRLLDENRKPLHQSKFNVVK